MKEISGGITAPRGFRAGVARCGIKYRDRNDLALIVSDKPASCAGVFTTNRIKAAPVIVSRERVRNDTVRAIIANSGNANACTGEDGLAAALAMTQETARLLRCDPLEVLVASTGVIGRRFPIDKIITKLPEIVMNLSYKGSADAAKAIMTTDTMIKETAVEFLLDDVPVRIGAISKGAGMISPDMATLLCFITTDADIRPSALRKALKNAVGKSFNCITVDGDMSTNDTVVVLANGEANNTKIRSSSTTFDLFSDALTQVCLAMARKIVRDGEGATKFITIQVSNAPSFEEARVVGLSVANSQLVKTALFGNDPNWGRIIAAVGYSGVPVQETLITISLNSIVLFENGSLIEFDNDTMKKEMSNRDLLIEIDLSMGKSSSTIYTSDLSYEYVKINAEYTT